MINSSLKITLDQYELISTGRVQMTVDQTAKFEQTIDGEPFNVHVKLTHDVSSASSYRFEGQGDHATLDLINWNSSIPSTTPEMISAGYTNLSTIFITVTTFAIQHWTSVELTFFKVPK